MAHPNIIPTVKFNTAIPIDVMHKMTLHLWSHTEHRVPKGAYQRFLVSLIRKYFEELKDDPQR